MRHCVVMGFVIAIVTGFYPHFLLIMVEEWLCFKAASGFGRILSEVLVRNTSKTWIGALAARI